MMAQTARRTATAGMLTLALSLTLVVVAHAQQPATLDFTVTENRVPGADGTGTITPLAGDQLRVEVRLTGMPPSGEHAMHIHLGDGARCDTNAPIVYPLNNVQVDAGGVGTSTTTITLRPDQPVRAGNAYINVHQAPTVPSPGVICANIDTTFAVSTTAPGGQMASAMPRTGTGLPADTALTGRWLVATAMAGLAGVAAMARLAAGRRHR